MLTPESLLRKIADIHIAGDEGEDDAGPDSDTNYEHLMEIVPEAREVVAQLPARHAARRRDGADGAARLYLYRVLETDDDNDPLDHGVARATSIEEAAELIRLRLSELGMEDGIEFKVYPLVDTIDVGVLDDDAKSSSRVFEL